MKRLLLNFEIVLDSPISRLHKLRMTNPETSQSPDEESNPEGDPNAIVIEGAPAELRDAGDQVVSTGRYLYFHDRSGAKFYPNDQASLSTLQSRAKTLFLIEEKESRTVSGVYECTHPGSNDPSHFHVKLTSGGASDATVSATLE